MGNLGYGQTNPDLASIPAEAEYGTTPRRLHEAEQAVAAERALRDQMQHDLQAQRDARTAG